MANGSKKTQRSDPVRVALGALIFSLLVCLGNSWNSWLEFARNLENSELPEIYTFEVVNEYPHDREAFTQGLLYAGNGTLYESTGLYNQSSVRRVALQTGKVEAQHNLDSSLFGEGLTLLDERLYQLTWKETFGFIYDKHTLSQLSKFDHQMTDGWGLATDGKIFFGSDGTSTLYQMDPQTMKVIKKHTIKYGGVEVFYLNELEYVNGEVWANVWQTDCIARISPADGTLIGWIILSSLREGLIAAGETDIDVLNGIAWDAQGNRIFVTGKWWPKLYEIKVYARDDQSHHGIEQLCIPNQVYHGILLDGTQVVVKELFLSSVKAEEFRSMMEAIPNITHKNLVKMIGYCVKEWQPYARYILVSECVDNGNLHQWLHEDEVGDISIPLAWRTRMNIISGIAKGLAYMHEDVDPKMVHGRLQSCKVLLDRQWNPKISDFAVGGLLGLKRRLFTDAGYMAPEYAMAGEMDEKSDVYSFGILVMEIISGRKPIDHDRPKEEMQHVEWLKLMVSIQNYKHILDPRITQVPPLKELKRVLLIALRCVDLTPENRPKMGQVIHMLQPNDLLLSDGKESVRQSSSHESQVFSQMFSDYRVSDNDFGVETNQHSNSNRELAIVNIM